MFTNGESRTPYPGILEGNSLYRAWSDFCFYDENASMQNSDTKSAW
ncbi:hypothetical protein YpE1979001_1826 [Yersinia pestis biovar Antiqua str. E1979001]|nr:hypothetical protein YpAngola_A2867 [Yersinia pestis Angola]EDR45174.1 hypothetical protein YpE1979001_1826 [Yersinia pestis biovar Antiqua str. E1979001]